MKRIQRTFWITLALSACIAGCSSDSALEETEQRGSQIVKAIESFRDETGAYPGSLDQLLPKFIHEIPPPTWGLERWIYESWEDEFVLYVKESSRTGDGIAHWFAYESSCPELGWELGD